MEWSLAAGLVLLVAAGWDAWRQRRRRRQLEERVRQLEAPAPEQAAAQGDARRELAQKVAGLGYWEWEITNDRLWWSPEEYALLGYPESTRPTLEAFFQRVHPGDRERIEQATQRLLEAPAEADIEFRILHPERGVRHIFSRTQVITDASGRTVKLIGTEQDLTSLRRAEAALGESERRYRNMFNAAPVALWEEDYSQVLAAVDSVPGGTDELRHYLDAHPEFVDACAQLVRVLDANEAAAALCGVASKSELLGALDPLLVPETRAVLKDQLVAIAERRRHFASEFLVPDLGGRRLHLRLEMRPPANIEEARRVLVSLIDITGRKQADLERERLIAELEAKNAELERFTYTVSHDLRSPLVTIKGFIGHLDRDLESGDVGRLRDDLARIEAAATHMQRLLSDLLQLSRIGRIAEPAERLRFAELVAEAADRIGGTLSERGVILAVQPDLPTVFGDRLRLVEVLQNLLENAVRFMGDQPRPRIEVGSRVDDGETVLFVRDNGIGIPQQHQKRVFGLFQRLDPATEGSGVGLSLAKRIVEVHGGRIWVESQGAGAGSTFCLTLASEPAAAAAPG